MRGAIAGDLDDIMYIYKRYIAITPTIEVIWPHCQLCNHLEKTFKQPMFFFKSDDLRSPIIKKDMKKSRRNDFYQANSRDEGYVIITI